MFHFVKANGWYINLDQVTYIQIMNDRYVRIGYLGDDNNHIELTNEDATAFLEAFEGSQGRGTMPADLTTLRRNAGT